jgi:hypothetical protein
MPFPPTPTNAWDTTFPPDTQLANLLGADLRQVRLDVMQRMSLLSGVFANRPTPEIVNATWGGVGFGLIYLATDTKQLFQWNGAVWVDISASLPTVSGGGFKLEGTNIVPVTVVNTAALTQLQAINIPANDIGAGQTFYIDATGVLGWLTNPGLTIGLYLDGVLIGSVNPTTAGSLNNQTWSLRTFFTGLVVGAGGSVSAAELGFIFSANTSPLPNNVPGGSVAIDTTVGHTLTLKVLWGVANASNTITSNVMSCYRTG